MERNDFDETIIIEVEDPNQVRNIDEELPDFTGSNGENPFSEERKTEEYLSPNPQLLLTHPGIIPDYDPEANTTKINTDEINKQIAESLKISVRISTKKRDPLLSQSNSVIMTGLQKPKEKNMSDTQTHPLIEEADKKKNEGKH